MKLNLFMPAIGIATLILASCAEFSKNKDANISHRDGKRIDSSSDGARSVVRLEMKDENGQFKTVCSGILVDPRVVLTAAHCLVSVDEETGIVGDLIRPDSIQIRLSNGFITKGTRSDYPRNFALAINHVDGLDIGYLVLGVPASSDLVAKVSTFNEFDNWTNSFASRGQSIGFGKTANSSLTAGNLNSLDLPYVGFYGPPKDVNTFDIRPASRQDKLARPLEFMAGFGVENTCSGDSGGGMFISIGNQMKLAGIASRTLAAPNPEIDACAVGTLTSIYGFAEAALNWAKRLAPEAFSDEVNQ